jgi:DNA-binding NarL/FixJ family response regulator
MSLETVLIVEDDALVAFTLETVLTDAGFRVVGSVDTGSAAVAACACLEPAVVLMDINLKGSMDGVEAAAALQPAGDPAVVFLTGQGDAATRTRAMQLRPASYLLKPFLVGDLVTAVSTAARARSARKGVPPTAA